MQDDEEKLKEFVEASLPENPIVPDGNESEEEASEAMHPSDRVQDYNRIINFTDAWLNPESLMEKLRSHQIYRDEVHSQLEMEILKITHSQNFEVIELEVRLRFLLLTIRLLNHNGASPLHKLRCIAQGNFGKVYYYEQQDFQRNLKKKAVKCLVHSPTKPFQDDLLLAIQQYAILKVAAAIESGPDIDFNNFDIHIYRHQSKNEQKDEICCIEFEMEYCGRDNNLGEAQKIENMKTLCALHRVGVVHCDIKPENLLFSEKRNKWILLDYGVAACLIQPIGFRSFTTLRGTLNYCSEQMHAIWAKSSGYVDLYWNDLFGLKKTHATLDKDQDQDLSLNTQSKAPFQQENATLMGKLQNHFLMIHLKYNLYFGNYQKAEYYRSRIDLRVQNKKQIAIFLKQLRYLPEPLRISYQSMSEGLKKGKLELVSSNMAFNKKYQEEEDDITKRGQLFRLVLNAIELGRIQNYNPKLQDIQRKQKEKVKEALKFQENAAKLEEDIYLTVLFRALNFLSDNYHFCSELKIQFCNVYISLKQPSNETYLFMAALQTVFNNFLQICLKKKNHILKRYFLQIYVNWLLLGLGNTEKIKEVYSMIPQLSKNPAIQCETFLDFYSCNFWFEQMLYQKMPLDCIEIRKHAQLIMREICPTLKNITHENCSNNSESTTCLCNERAMLKVLQRSAFHVRSQPQDFVSRVNRCTEMLNSLSGLMICKMDKLPVVSSKNLKQISYKLTDNTNKKIRKNKLAYQRELPFYLGDLYIKEYSRMNSASFYEVSTAIEEYINCNQVTNCWQIMHHKKLIRLIKLQADANTRGFNEFLEEQQRKVMIENYQLKSYYLLQYYSNLWNQLYYQQEPAHLIYEEIRLDCMNMVQTCLLAVGDSFHPKQLAELIMFLQTEDSLHIWKFLSLKLSKGCQIEVSLMTLLEHFQHLLRQEICPIKQKIKRAEALLFKEKNSLLSKQQSRQAKKQLLSWQRGGPILELKIQLIEFCMLNKPQNKFYLIEQFHNVLLHHDFFTDFISKTRDPQLFINLIIALIKERKNKEAVEVLWGISQHLFGLMGRNVYIHFRKLKSPILMFFLDKIDNYDFFAGFRDELLAFRKNGVIQKLFVDELGIFLVTIQIHILEGYSKMQYSLAERLSFKKAVQLISRSMKLYHYLPYIIRIHELDITLHSILRYMIVDRARLENRFLTYIWKLIRKTAVIQSNAAWMRRLKEKYEYLQMYPIILRVKKYKQNYNSHFYLKARNLYKQKFISYYALDEENLLFKTLVLNRSDQSQTKLNIYF